MKELNKNLYEFHKENCPLHCAITSYEKLLACAVLSQIPITSAVLKTENNHDKLNLSPEWSCVEFLLLPSLHLLWGHFNLTHLQALGIVRLKQELIHTLNRFSVMYST